MRPTVEEQKQADAAQAEQVFRRRQKQYRVVLLLWAVVSLARVPVIADLFPDWNHLILWLFTLGGFATFAYALRAFRCTCCGGGIKLNGRTCSKCGHVFPLR
jgi:hypothetical protein